MKKIYVSCYNNNDRKYKERLINFNKERNDSIFELVKSQTSKYLYLDPKQNNFIKWIKNKYLRDTEVLILLIGLQTKNRKHVDWEIRAAMESNSLYDKSGILVVYLDEVAEKYEGKIPRSLLPNILVDNIKMKNVYILETSWKKFTKNYSSIEKSINVAYAYGQMSNYYINNDVQLENSSEIQFIKD